MLNSNRSKTNTIVKLTAALALSLVALGTAPQAFAQYAPGASRHVTHSRSAGAATRSGREAFGMASEYGFIDPNSPAATGGGSLGYNRKLLEY